MKAKDYAKIYNEKLAETNDYAQAIDPVLKGLIEELSTLTQTRGKSTFSAAISCFDEIEQKWRAFSYLINDGKTWKPDGFMLYMNEIAPTLTDLYRMGKHDQEFRLSLRRK